MTADAMLGTFDDLHIGDVIQVTGDTVPLDLVDKYFRVLRIDPETARVTLSPPCSDAAMRHPYRPRAYPEPQT